jgi:putative tryptophan/tyrosine transport system substrate-binding protein
VITRRVLLRVAVAMPLATRTHAQANPSRPRVVGLIMPGPWAGAAQAFLSGMREHGWAEGTDFVLEQRVTGPDHGRAAALAAELQARGAEVLATINTGVAVEAHRGAPSLPLVMLVSGYPVEAGLAASLARPGGNVTGLSMYAGSEIFAKQVQMLAEARPSLRHLVVLWDYPAQTSEPAFREMQRAADVIGIGLEIIQSHDLAGLGATLARLDRGQVDTLLITLGGVHATSTGRSMLEDYVARRRALVAVDGGRIHQQSKLATLAYGTDTSELCRRAAWYVDRIMNGAKPGELPIQLPEIFTLGVNLRLTRELGIELATGILARADEVIE